MRVPIYYVLRPNLRDESDNMVFECCANYAANYLVTHNTRDFERPELSGYAFRTVTPQQFLKEVINT